MTRTEPQPQPFKTTLKSIYTLLWFTESRGITGNMSIFIPSRDAFGVLYRETADLSKNKCRYIRGVSGQVTKSGANCLCIGNFCLLPFFDVIMPPLTIEVCL